MPNGKIRFAAIYGNGAVMGFSPREVDAMSMWQFQAALEGYLKANTAEDAGALSDAEKNDLAEWLGI